MTMLRIDRSRRVLRAAVLLLLTAPAVGSAVTPAPQAPTAAAAPTIKLPVPSDAAELSPWISGFFPWGEGTVKLEELPQVRIPGYRLVRAQKTYAADSRFNDQTFMALEDGGKTAIVGDAMADEERLARPAPVKTEADLDALRERLKKFFRMPFRLSLDPALDRRSFKGVKVRIDSGYGLVDMSAYVKADDGSLMILGRAWERNRSFVEQRKELIKLEDTPFHGPANAKVTVVEYSDLQCGFCKRRGNQWEPLVAKLAPVLTIKRYIKSFPLTDHSWAFRAASAGRCFFEFQPKTFFTWKTQVYSRQDQLDVASLDSFALDFAMANSVPEDTFKSCYLQAKSVHRVLADLTEGYALRVRATPTFFVDGVAVSWITDNLMEEFLRITYLKGAGLPLPTPPPTPAGGPKK